MLQDLKCGFFEEPCPWEELSETKRVADALAMPVAVGEQDASLWRFHWMIENRVFDIVQPDLNYNGGFIRAARCGADGARGEDAHRSPQHPDRRGGGEHFAVRLRH